MRQVSPTLCGVSELIDERYHPQFDPRGPMGRTLVELRAPPSLEAPLVRDLTERTGL